MVEAGRTSTARQAREEDAVPPSQLRAKPVAGPVVSAVVPVLRIVPPPAPATARMLVLALWIERYHLTKAEGAVLGLAADGLTLSQIAHVRRRAFNTVRKQSETLREKTFDDSLALAANRLLAEAEVLA